MSAPNPGAGIEPRPVLCGLGCGRPVLRGQPAFHRAGEPWAHRGCGGLAALELRVVRSKRVELGPSPEAGSGNLGSSLGPRPVDAGRRVLPEPGSDQQPADLAEARRLTARWA